MAKIIGNTTTTPMAVPDWSQDDSRRADYIKNKPTLGSLAAKDEVSIGDLSQEVINMIDGIGGSFDFNETDPTVPDWAKEPTKPTYTADEVGAIAYTAQALTEEQKAQARSNIGAGTSTFSGDYNDLDNKPVAGSILYISIVNDVLNLLQDDPKYTSSINNNILIIK